ncbi:MAG TPA: hypothetical protein EYP41_18815 [Anaerolineae bacterium]|nr:hypothetical protein [Anaerolineae bacterium]HIP73333.1 hypothetical protein [Anaerolineae bacterium]
MKKQLLLILILLSALALMPAGLALAHGGPEIVVEPTIVPAGGEITITGSEMEEGELFLITLEGMTDSILLGEADAVEEGGEGGFEVTFIVPLDTPPGAYTVRAATDEETALVEITITPPTDEASDEPVTIQEPSGELHDLDRSKPVIQVIGVVIAALVSLGLGFWLVRR